MDAEHQKVTGETLASAGVEHPMRLPVRRIRIFPPKARKFGTRPRSSLPDVLFGVEAGVPFVRGAIG
jgi:hypothetical protein